MSTMNDFIYMRKCVSNVLVVLLFTFQGITVSDLTQILLSHKIFRIFFFANTVLPRYIANICSGQILALKRGWQYNEV